MSDAAASTASIRKMLKKIKPPEAAVRNYVRRMFDNGFDDGTYYRGSSPAAPSSPGLPNPLSGGAPGAASPGWP